jgi:N-acetyl-gamma-glutamyl-phosphate reductase
MHNYSFRLGAALGHISSLEAGNRSNKISCSIIGARGYAGLETARLLLNHPHADLVHCFATSDFNLESYLSHPKAKLVRSFSDAEIFNHPTEVYFLATPAEVSLKLAPKLLSLGKKVIDLSGAFRLKKHDYQEWYGLQHDEKELLQLANYGLVPWVGPFSSVKTSLISNPGCYATAISMALIPLLKDGLIHSEGIVIDAKSGTSGAGKKASENLLFTEVEGECLPYKVGKHQHFPEIVETVANFTGKQINPHFSTSLLATRRGIIANIYAELKDGLGLRDIEESFGRAYKDSDLVTHGPLKSHSQLLSLKRVVGTSKTHLSYEVSGKKVYLFSCIDNLMKGAAGQAIENFNRIYDYHTSTGLNHLEAII